MNNAGQKFMDVFNRLEAESKRNEDIVTPLNSLRVDENFVFRSDDLGALQMSDYAFTQLCGQVANYSLPAEYLKKLYNEDPMQFAELMNFHLANGRNLKRKFRITRSEEENGLSALRGIVSETYTPYDNIDALHILKDSLHDRNFELKNINFNDKFMFMRVILQDSEINFGRSADGRDDINFIGLDIVNSEVGYMSIVSNASLYRLVCENGLVAKEADYGFFKHRHAHIDPMVLNERLHQSIIQGVSKGSHMIEKFKQARQVRVDNPYEMITQYGSRANMSDKMLVEARKNYDYENDKSLFGVVNAFTRTARDTSNVERRIQLEKLASKVMDSELKIA